MKAEQFSDPIAFHGEGAFWDDGAQRLLIVDMLAGDVLQIGGGGDHRRHHVGTVAAAIRARASGGFVVAVERGVVFTDDELFVRETLPEFFADSGIRMNDGGCDPRGRFYCGTMAYDQTPGAAVLYRLDLTRGVTTALCGATISNGLQWSADGRRVFYNDTPTGRVDVFDFDADTGEFSNRRPFVALEPGQNPDGMANDDAAGIWVALWGASAVHHFDETGALVDVVELPVSQVSSCTFGGPDRETLYITTSREHLPPDAEPVAGAVFAVRPGARGAVPFAFAG